MNRYDEPRRLGRNAFLVDYVPTVALYQSKNKNEKKAKKPFKENRLKNKRERVRLHSFSGFDV